MTETAARDQKFRQAAMVYLHVTVLYEAAGVVMWEQDMMHRGPPLAWLVGGLVVGGGLSYALYRWRNPWLPRGIWLLNAIRLPALIKHAFVVDIVGQLSPAFYVTAIVVIVTNMWMLARAGWDL